MSETTSNSGTTKKTTGNAALPGHASIKADAENMTETVAETANTANGQGRDVLLMGMRTAADVGSHVADIGFGRSHDIMSSAVHAMDIYRDVTERSAERVQALFSSAMVIGRGFQSMQHAVLEMMDHSMEHAARKPRDLLHCKTPIELAELQRDLYLDAIGQAFASTSRLLEIAGRTVRDAVTPLRS